MNPYSLSGYNQNEIMALGAEARVSKGKYLNYDVVAKERFQKAYRVPSIDYILRKDRTVQEIRLLQFARKVGVNVPYVYHLDKETWTIIMELVKGKSIKYLMTDQNFETYFEQIGKDIAILHNNDIIHGDLTTSNIIIDSNKKIWIIDFGLGYISNQVEDKAVDLLVLKHTIESSHPLQFKKAYAALMGGYKSNSKFFSNVEKRMDKIELRVRYKTHIA